VGGGGSNPKGLLRELWLGERAPTGWEGKVEDPTEKEFLRGRGVKNHEKKVYDVGDRSIWKL